MKRLMLWLFAVAGLLAPVSIFAQTNATLNLSMQVLFRGRDMTNGEAVRAPADFFILPSVRTSPAPHPGEGVTIDFYADGHLFSSQRAVWHAEFNPSKNARPGEAVPMFIRPAQFFYKEVNWTNVPEGPHVLQAQVHDFRGLSASSPPMQVTVLPPQPTS